MTKAESIAAQLRDRIDSGEWGVGAGLPSRGELALEYGVSPATVTGAIRELQKEGRVRVMQGKGAYVAEPAEAAALSQGLIGLTGSYLPSGAESNWFSRAILDGIWQEANGRHCPVVMLPQAATGTGITREYCQQLGVQGLIFLGGEGYANARQLKEEGFPVILANKPAEPTTLNYLDYDNFFVIRETARRFLKAGHRRIAVIYAEGSVAQYYRDMKLQFLDELMQHGAVYDLAPYWRGVLRQPGKGGVFRGVKHVAEELFDLPEPPTAIFCWEPGMAQPLMKVVEKRRLRVPDDLSIIVSSYGSETEMEFSGFVVPHRELGIGLVRELCATMEKSHHGIQTLLKPRYIEHGTVGDAPAD